MAKQTGSKKAPEAASGDGETREAEKKNSQWRVKFIEKLAETSNVTKAAEHAGVEPSHAYKTRRDDPKFARRWRSALVEGYEHLELETIRRLRDGTKAEEPKFDIGSALRLLALHKDSVAKERAKVEHADEAQVLASLNKRLDYIRRNEGELKKALSSKVLPLLPEPVREK